MDKDCETDDVKRALIDVEKAGEDVRVAAGALAVAETNLEHAEHELKEAQEHPANFTVDVIYNGLTRRIDAKADELVKALLTRAIAAFGNPPNNHTLALWTKGGSELNDAETVKAAGVKPCETLLLRPSAVKGGAQ